MIVGTILGLLGLGIAWKWRHFSKSKEHDDPSDAAEVVDPRLTIPTPYRNVRPDVQYVGDQACAVCHADKSKSFHQHPMGQDLAPVAQALPVERYEPSALNPFVASELHFGVERRANRVFHREWAADTQGKVVAEKEAEVQFAIGSATNGRGYLVNFEGYLFQSPISWYSQAGQWDLSPGYAPRNQHFGRPITPACLFCHCNHAEHVPNTVNRYRQPIFQGHAIGCERCHGPGELHVRRRTDDAHFAGPDDTIVNPAKLEHSLRGAVCQQCHLQGEQRVLARGLTEFDYRPGLPLHLFVMDFVNEGELQDASKSVRTVGQMHASRCFRASKEPNKLECISCHDPHQLPAPQDKNAFYRGRCLQCHLDDTHAQTRGDKENKAVAAGPPCSLPSGERRLNENNCVTCHMPRTGSEVSHSSITDHRVPRRPELATNTAAPHPSSSFMLVPFHRDLVDPHDEEVMRNLGVALMAMVDRRSPNEMTRHVGLTALPLLEHAVKRDRHDMTAWNAQGDALWAQGRREEALAVFDAALAENPDWEVTLHGAGSLAMELRRPEVAQLYLERVIRVNPWRWQYFHLLATASMKRGQWEQAERSCQQSLKLQPFNILMQTMLVECYLRMGQQAKAQAEFDTLLRLSPEFRREDLCHWFDGLRKKASAAK